MFTLDYPEAFQDFYSRGGSVKGGMAERIADQVATVCAMLGEYPAVRYRRYCVREFQYRSFLECCCPSSSEASQLTDIAEAVQVRLDAYKADKRELGTVSPLVWPVAVELKAQFAGS